MLLKRIEDSIAEMESIAEDTDDHDVLSVAANLGKSLKTREEKTIG